ncbi:sushi, nidogen and EGF-like domain-containing protein 1 [Physella acuta]|uniref:sushi, nidogen and EGF-like domain-containing protein 1 n=1 Tax=Physella acuta TaxID=109671 RepID=UPI0027DCD2D7|nr:sushi, nidogen and EGF-like domain-containing protein 1 [Physella acuta]
MNIYGASSEDPCSRFICYNGGYCSANGSPSTCVCPPDFTGQRCEKEVTPTARCPVKETSGFGIHGGIACSDDLPCADDQICCNSATGRRCTYVPNHRDLNNPTCGGCPMYQMCLETSKKCNVDPCTGRKYSCIYPR